jgi:hypothetical protein
VAQLMGQPTGNFTRQFLLLDPPVQREPQGKLVLLGKLEPRVRLGLLVKLGLLV